ncbi:hypothetical protein [Dyadobacter helix]|uniref:hypothetical protein n=1 Tax=Dyadobacter helix TaxID=2822344 RepID=UPI001BFCB8BE|nr:hypothetical protein [Dyadobacter sp. CECT 9275]
MSEDRIVSPKRAKEIISGVLRDQSYFICHKASIDGKDICCRKFYDEMGDNSQLIRIAERLNAIQFVEMPETEKLPTWKEMHKS